MLTKFLLDEYIGGPLGLGNAHIFGMFLDDRWVVRWTITNPVLSFAVTVWVNVLANRIEE